MDWDAISKIERPSPCTELNEKHMDPVITSNLNDESIPEGMYTLLSMSEYISLKRCELRIILYDDACLADIHIAIAEGVSFESCRNDENFPVFENENLSTKCVNMVWQCQQETRNSHTLTRVTLVTALRQH